LIFLRIVCLLKPHEGVEEPCLAGELYRPVFSHQVDTLFYLMDQFSITGEMFLSKIEIVWF